MKLLNGDCLEELKKLESNSIESLVTDPPAGIAFMNKEWDKDKGGRDPWIEWMTEVMAESLRVLKPGAHGLVWALPRTSHWTATALENAGFEIRDVVTHIFGSGFPKNHDVSKAIDKLAGAEREKGPTVGELSGRNIENHKKSHDILAQVNGWDKHTTTPATDDAKKWSGYGTALKPSNEHWILIRKPLEKKLTVAKNVLKHGVGVINIDASRIEIPENDPNDRKGKQVPQDNNSMFVGIGAKRGAFTVGRFPANTLVDESAVGELDEQSGISKSAGGGMNRDEKNPTSYKFSERTKVKNCGKGDTGGASRFFYCPKAPKKDKGINNLHPTVKHTKLMTYLITLVTPTGGTVLDPFMGSGSTGVAAVKADFDFVGIEKEKEYFDIAEARIDEEIIGDW